MGSEPRRCNLSKSGVHYATSPIPQYSLNVGEASATEHDLARNMHKLYWAHDFESTRILNQCGKWLGRAKGRIWHLDWKNKIVINGITATKTCGTILLLICYIISHPIYRSYYELFTIFTIFYDFYDITKYYEYNFKRTGWRVWLSQRLSARHWISDAAICTAGRCCGLTGLKFEGALNSVWIVCLIVTR